MFSRQHWRDFLENILIAIFLALFVRTFIFTGYKVPSSSMAPLLLPGDFIFSYRVPFGIKIPLTQFKFFIRVPSRGDVVVFNYPEQPRVNYVKRVIGLPGDKIAIKESKVYVNDSALMYQDASNESILEVPGYDTFKVMSETSENHSNYVMFNKLSGSKDFGPIIVPPEQVFLLGDNRDSSDDSRYWGTVPIDHIDGKIVLIWFSLKWTKGNQDSQLPKIRSDRIFTLVQ